jgi:hypothetical protein
MTTPFYNIGKWLIVAGIIMTLVGLMLILAAKVGLFKLPGDIHFGGKGWHIYIPITSSILISVLLTVILWVVRKLHH